MKRYVIGDVHGCADELKELLKKIYNHTIENNTTGKLIFVGDYVDRGPNSKEVVDIVRTYQRNGHVALMGNHEDMILAGQFMYAEETFRSFGSSLMELPEYVLNWMRSLPKYYEDDTIIVAHAGAKPGVPMNEQPEMMLLWYRYEQRGPALMGKHFYHGHTPFRGFIDTRDDRTNVDTGCVYDGQLTAAIVGDDGKPEGFIQVPKKGGMYDL